MRILLLWDYYPTYLDLFYASRPHLIDLPYTQQHQTLLHDFFGWPSYLVPHLQDLGHEAHIIVGNAESLQRAWAQENGVEYHRFKLIQEQIRRCQPDVLWVAGAHHYMGEFLAEIAPGCRLILAWAAYAGSEKLDLSPVHCVLTSHRVFVDQFQRLGKPAELLLPCFDPRILDFLPEQSRDIDLSFYGTLTATLFGRRIEMLSHLARHTPIRIWAEQPKLIRRPWPPGSFISQFRLWPLLSRMKGNKPVFGLDVFRLLRRSKITFNIHVDSAKNQAGNIRMFEATGTGTLLLTETASNLAQLFEPEQEVVTYSGKDDAVEKINYLLAHDNERQKIALAGQRRVLTQHNAAQRAQEFVDVVQSL